MLKVENTVEKQQDKERGKEQLEKHEHQISNEREECIEVVDEISGSEKNHKNSEFFHRLNIERIV